MSPKWKNWFQNEVDEYIAYSNSHVHNNVTSAMSDRSLLQSSSSYLTVDGGKMSVLIS